MPFLPIRHLAVKRVMPGKRTRRSASIPFFAYFAREKLALMCNPACAQTTDRKGLGNNRDNLKQLQKGRLATVSRMRTVARVRDDRQPVVNLLSELFPFQVPCANGRGLFGGSALASPNATRRTAALQMPPTPQTNITFVTGSLGGLENGPLPPKLRDSP